MLERCVVLEDEADAAPLRRNAGGVLARDLDAALVGHLEPRDDAQQRRLARAAGAEQCRERAFGDLERDVIEGGEVAPALRDALDADHADSLLGLSTVIARRVPRAMTASMDVKPAVPIAIAWRALRPSGRRTRYSALTRARSA